MNVTLKFVMNQNKLRKHFNYCYCKSHRYTIPIICGKKLIYIYIFFTLANAFLWMKFIMEENLMTLFYVLYLIKQVKQKQKRKL